MITTVDVINWAGLKTILSDDAHLMLIVPAVNEYVEGLPSIFRESDGSWAPQTKLGAIMLAARWYKRKDSQEGTTLIGDTALYVARYDADVSRLLNIDSFSKPVIG